MKAKQICPDTFLASINWNTLKRMNGDKYLQEIVDGMKVIVCKLKTNPLDIQVLHIQQMNYVCPDWFKELPFDNDAMEETIIDNKLGNLIGVLNYDIASTLQKNTFNNLLTLEAQMKAKRNRLERKLDEYNHIMELIRTIVPIAVLIIQVIILMKLV